MCRGIAQARSGMKQDLFGIGSGPVSLQPMTREFQEMLHFNFESSCALTTGSSPMIPSARPAHTSPMSILPKSQGALSPEESSRTLIIHGGTGPWSQDSQRAHGKARNYPQRKTSRYGKTGGRLA